MKPSKSTNEEAPFVRRRNYIENEKMQIDLAPIALNLLRNTGISEEKELKIEFFFYSRNQIKADALAEALTKLKYDVYTCKSAGRQNLILVTGCTTKMKIDDDTIKYWTENMSDIAYRFDCKFDGWGTTPDQD